jgi:hypothetical protein
MDLPCARSTEIKSYQVLDVVPVGVSDCYDSHAFNIVFLIGQKPPKG